MVYKIQLTHKHDTIKKWENYWYCFELIKFKQTSWLSIDYFLLPEVINSNSFKEFCFKENNLEWDLSNEAHFSSFFMKLFLYKDDTIFYIYNNIF